MKNTDRSLEEIRKEINHINIQMLELFEKRMELSKEVAIIKSEEHIEVLNKEREKEILNQIKAVISSKDLELYAGEFFEGLMKLSREYQEQVIESRK